MNIFGWVLLAALAAVALADWVAVARADRAAERLAKPAFMVLLLAFAWLLHADEVPQGRWLLAGLALCLVGDVLLLDSEVERRFRLGLTVFLLAHVAYLVALVEMPHASPLWPGVVLVGLVLVLALAGGLVPLARRDPATGGPPTAYGVVLAGFAGYAWFSGHLLLGIGASLFVVSDALIGFTRFVRDFARSHVVVMVTYHVAQLLIVVGVLRPDVAGLG